MQSEMEKFFKGEWVDTDIVCNYFGITFSQGLRLFDFSRMAKWNPAPLNGQEIITKFRLKNVIHDDLKDGNQYEV